MDDLAAIGSALLEPGYLRQKSLTQLFTVQRPTNPARRKSSYGIGWGFAENDRGRNFYLHTGDQQGASSMLMILPKGKIVIAILCNQFREKLLSRDVSTLPFHVRRGRFPCIGA